MSYPTNTELYVAQDSDPSLLVLQRAQFEAICAQLSEGHVGAARSVEALWGAVHNSSRPNTHMQMDASLPHWDTCTTPALPPGVPHHTESYL